MHEKNQGNSLKNKGQHNKPNTLNPSVDFQGSTLEFYQWCSAWIRWKWLFLTKTQFIQWDTDTLQIYSMCSKDLVRRVPFSSNVHGVCSWDEGHHWIPIIVIVDLLSCFQVINSWLKTQNHLEIDDILTVALRVYSSPVILKECNLHRLPTGPAIFIDFQPAQPKTSMAPAAMVVKTFENTAACVSQKGQDTGEGTTTRTSLWYL